MHFGVTPLSRIDLTQRAKGDIAPEELYKLGAADRDRGARASGSKMALRFALRPESEGT
jgi:hypothetical protein